MCLIILAVLGLFYGTVFVLCKIYINPQKISELIINQTQKKLNRTVTLGEEISLNVDWDMTPHLTLHKVTIGNATWASNPNMLTVDELQIHFSLAKLLFKQFYINEIKLYKPKLYLESTPKQNNWDFEQNAQSNTESNVQMTVERVTIRNGLIMYNQDKITIDKFDLTAHDNNTAYHIHLLGKHNSLPIKTTLDIGLTQDQFKLQIINLQSGSSDLHGNILIKKSPMRINGEFESNKIVIKDFSTANANPSGEYSLPNKPLPIEQLRNAEFDVKLQIQTLDMGGIDLNKVSLKAKNINNILTIKLDPAAKIANGNLNLDMTYDLNPTIPTFSLKSKTSTIPLGSVLIDMFGKTPIIHSTVDFTTDLQGAGGDLNAIVNSLNGRILIQAGPGEFLHDNIVSGSIFNNILTSIITFDKQTPSTAFKCGVMNFRVNDGIAKANNGIGIEAANVNVLGNGMVDLRNGRISFSIVPQSFISNPLDLAHFSVAQLVAIKGTLSKPEVTFNAGNLIKQSAGALITAGIAGGMTGGIGSAAILATGALTSNKQKTASPCQTALSN